MKFFWLISSIVSAYISVQSIAAADSKPYSRTGTLQTQNLKEGTITIDWKTYRFDNEAVIHDGNFGKHPSEQPSSHGHNTLNSGGKIGFNLDRSDNKNPRISEIWLLSQ